MVAAIMSSSFAFSGISFGSNLSRRRWRYLSCTWEDILGSGCFNFGMFLHAGCHGVTSLFANERIYKAFDGYRMIVPFGDCIWKLLFEIDIFRLLGRSDVNLTLVVVLAITLWYEVAIDAKGCLGWKLYGFGNRDAMRASEYTGMSQGGSFVCTIHGLTRWTSSRKKKFNVFIIDSDASGSNICQKNQYYAYYFTTGSKADITITPAVACQFSIRSILSIILEKIDLPLRNHWFIQEKHMFWANVLILLSICDMNWLNSFITIFRK